MRNNIVAYSIRFIFRVFYRVNTRKSHLQVIEQCLLCRLKHNVTPMKTSFGKQLEEVRLCVLCACPYNGAKWKIKRKNAINLLNVYF